MPPLIVRVDAGANLGMGHLVRCLALVQAWGGAAEILRAEDSDGDPGSDADARATAARAQAAGAAWVVVDGYQFGTAFQRTLRAAGLRVLCVDDNGEAGEYACDIVLNQNLHAEASLYRRRDGATRLLLGPEYVLLRREFVEPPRSAKVIAQTARRVLVTLGGGDAGETLDLVRGALEGARGFDVRVVTGGRSPEDMRSLMEWADLAVSAGGSTSWELAYIGVPTLAVVMAKNQIGAVGALSERGIVVPLGRRESLTGPEVTAQVERLARNFDRRVRMSDAGQALIDGGGAARVVNAMRME